MDNNSGIKRNAIRAAIVAVFVAACVAFSVVAADAAAQQAQAKLDARNSSVRGPYLADGTFAGKAASYGGPMSVEVTVENGYITSVQVVTTFDDSPYIDDVMAAKIPEIELEQSYELDVVSNASYSSHGLLNAVRNALVNGGAVEGESAQSTSSQGISSTTSALKKRAEQKDAEERGAWYETTFGYAFGLSEAEDTDDSAPKSSGIAGQKLEQGQ